MIIPSIDLMGGHAVQLIGGQEMELDAGDPRPIARRFRRAGEIAVIDLDAAMGQGTNRSVIEELIAIAPCRVGGGIRDVETARDWLDRGAAKVILGTRAVPEILEQLPRERVIAALDAVRGEIVVEGWKTKTGQSVVDRMKALSPLVGGFLVTFVESEGRLEGLDLERVAELAEIAGPDRLTVAGGVTSLDDLRAIDRLGCDAQVGMALYKGRFSLDESIACVLEPVSGPWPTVLTDPGGRFSGFGFASTRDLAKSVETGVPELEGRSLAGELLRIDVDKARRALRFRIEGGRDLSSFGTTEGLGHLFDRLRARKGSAPPGSYTARLLSDAELLGAKLAEEARELVEARGPEETAWEAADLIYFALVKMVREGASLEDVERTLAERSLKVSRRPGDAKPDRSGGDP